MIRLMALSAIAAATSACKATGNEVIANQWAGLQLIATFNRLPIDFAISDGSMPCEAVFPKSTGTTDDGRALARISGEPFTSTHKDLSS